MKHEVCNALEEEERRDRLELVPIRIDDEAFNQRLSWVEGIHDTTESSGRHIGDITDWKDYDAYQEAFDRSLRDRSPSSS